MMQKSAWAAGITCLALLACNKTGAESDLQDAADSEDEMQEVLEEGAAETPCRDDDGDGFKDSDCGGEDCDDARSDIFPGAEEVCGDGVDNDCDGHADEPYFVLPGVLISDELHGQPMDSSVDGGVFLAWTGSGFAAAWSFAHGLICDGPQQAYFTRLDEHGVELGEDVALPYDESLACYASGCPFMVWTGSELGSARSFMYLEADVIRHVISIERLSVSGEVLGEGLHARDSEIPGGCSSIAWTGGSFGIAWHEDRQGIWDDSIHFTTVNADMTEAGDDVVLGGGQHSASMAWTGSEFGVSWVEIVSEDRPWELHLARLDPSGEAAGGDSKLLDVGIAHYTEIVWTGSGYALAWNERDEVDYETSIHYLYVEPGGEHSSEDVILYENASLESIGWNGAEVCFIMECEGTISLGRVDPEGLHVGERVDLASREGVVGGFSDLAWTGSEFGIAWSNLGMSDSIWRVYFNRISLCD